MIQNEETKFKAAVSESLAQRVGSVTNFIVNRENSQHDFNLNGQYNIIDTPYYLGDGYISYPWAFEIVDVIMYLGDATGTSGFTELDIKWTDDTESVSYTTIFSTKPKAAPTAVPYSSVRIGQTKTGWTPAVLSKSTFAAYDKLRVDVTDAMGGPVNGVYLKLFIRPRDPA